MCIVFSNVQGTDFVSVTLVSHLASNQSFMPELTCFAFSITVYLHISPSSLSKRKQQQPAIFDSLCL